MKSYKILTRDFLASYISALRVKKQLTQEEMAEKLRISSRAYGDLERGKYCFSAITLLFLLLMLDEDEVKSLLRNFREKVKSFERKEVA